MALPVDFGDLDTKRDWEIGAPPDECYDFCARKRANVPTSRGTTPGHS